LSAASAKFSKALKEKGRCGCHGNSCSWTARRSGSAALLGIDWIAGSTRILPPTAARTRGLDIKRQVADAVARAEAKGVVERWNQQREVPVAV
jgi:hypothetical protein